MPLRWISQPTPAQLPLSPLTREEPKIVLAAPGTVVTPRHRLTQVLAASSLLAVAFRPLPVPLPRALASTFNVSNNNDVGVGSLRQAILDANAQPGPDVITFSPNVSGTISLAHQLTITDSVAIQAPGPGKLSVSGANVTRVFYLTPTAPITVAISGLTIRDGLAPANGGGLLDAGASLILDQVAVISNTAGSKRGGGIAFESILSNTASLIIRNSLITGNAARRGGGISVYQPGGSVLIQNTQVMSNAASKYGGGLFLYKTYADVTIEDTTIAGNSATGTSGGGIDFYKAYGGTNVVRRTTISGNSAVKGAGVMLYKVHSPLVIENTTISGNSASKHGGGVYSEKSLFGTIQNSTIVSNSATNLGGGIEVLTATVPVTDSIIAGNTAPLGADITGTFQLSYDLVQVTGTATISDAGGNLFGLDPLLGPLADNGGPTQTHLPAANSPAVNAGDPAFAPPPATDQRGRPRLVGRLDIGAVERRNDIFLPLTRR